MARRRKRSSSSARSSSPGPPLAAAESAGASEVRPTDRRGWVIIGGFAAVSLVIFFASLSGFRTANHTRKATEALAEDRPADAIPHLEYIAELRGGNWKRYRQLGACYLETGDFESALAAYENSLEIKPNQPLDAKLGRAHYLRDSQSAEARTYLKKALAAKPEDPEANFYYGIIRFDSGKPIQAAGHFQKASANPRFLDRSKPYLLEIRSQVLGDLEFSSPS